MQNLRLEYDIQHHVVLSKRNSLHHALIRMVISTLSTAEELRNLRKKDLKVRRVKGEEEYSVKLRAEGKIRISPIDVRTGNLLLSLPDKPFQMSDEEMNLIVEKYSPRDRKYDLEKLRKAVIVFLKDASFDLVELEDLKNPSSIRDFMLDFNPLYSGLWDLDDDEIAEDFVLNYSTLTGISDPKIIAEELGEEEERIRKILESGKKGLLSFLKG